MELSFPLPLSPIPLTSPRGVAAVHYEVATRHKGAGFAEEEEGGALELGGFGQPAHHVLRLPGLAQPGHLGEVTQHHRRHDVAGADAVDADAAGPVRPDRAPLHRQAARQLQDGGLGRVVDGREQALVGDEAAHAGDEAHAAVALVLEHLARRRRRRHHHARVVDRQHPGHVRLGVLHGGRDLLDPGRGDHAVEPLVLAGDVSDRPVQGRHVHDVLLPVPQRPSPSVSPPQRLAVVLMGFLLAVETVDYIISRRSLQWAKNIRR